MATLLGGGWEAIPTWSAWSGDYISDRAVPRRDLVTLALRSLLVGVSAHDPLTPARRASRLDLVLALRRDW